MYCVVQETVEEQIKVYFVRTATLDPKNGGWINCEKIGGSSLGLPISSVRAVTPVPMLPVSDMRDITAPDIVEVEIKEDGAVLWVNVDGQCALRCCRVKDLGIIDHRRTDTANDISDPH